MAFILLHAIELMGPSHPNTHTIVGQNDMLIMKMTLKALYHIQIIIPTNCSICALFVTRVCLITLYGHITMLFTIFTFILQSNHFKSNPYILLPELDVLPTKVHDSEAPLKLICHMSCYMSALNK